MSALWLVPIAAGFAVIWCHWVGALNRLERVEADRNLWQRRARDLGEQNYRLSVQLEEADAPLATIHHLPQVQRVAEVLAANEAKRNLTDERLDEALETWSDGGDAS